MNMSKWVLFVGATLLLPLHSYAASYNCAKAKTWSEKTVCNTKQLSNLDDLLAVAFQKALTSTSEKSALKAEQGEWLSAERDQCEDVACLKDAYTSRLAALQEKIANGEEPAAPSDKATGWYQSTAKPSLTVRDRAAVTGKKLGNVPYGGKVKVLEVTDQTDSIGGVDGTWVKIEWQSKTAYTFDAFLEKLSSGTVNNTKKPETTQNSKTGGKTLEGIITGYDCGDNCYLSITDKQGEEHSGLCTAPLCEAWNQAAEMPASFLNKRVKASVGTDTQYDGGGTSMGEMDAFESITVLGK